MCKAMIFVAVMTLLPASSAFARSAFDPENRYTYVDADAQQQRERRDIERQIEEEHTRAHLFGFASKSDHNDFHRHLEKARNDLYAWHDRKNHGH